MLSRCYESSGEVGQVTKGADLISGFHRDLALPRQLEVSHVAVHDKTQVRYGQTVCDLGEKR